MAFIGDEIAIALPPAQEGTLFFSKPDNIEWMFLFVSASGLALLIATIAHGVMFSS
jgi:hypothetical protein